MLKSSMLKRELGTATDPANGSKALLQTANDKEVQPASKRFLNRALPATPTRRFKMIDASLLLPPGMHETIPGSTRASVKTHAQQDDHAKPGDIVYMRKADIDLSCSAAELEGAGLVEQGTASTAQSVRDDRGNCILVSNALSTSLLSMPFVQHSERRSLMVVYELFQDLECSSVHVYDQATANETEGVTPIYTQIRPQTSSSREPAYSLTYHTECNFGAHGLLSSSSPYGSSSKEKNAEGSPPPEEDYYTRISRIGGDFAECTEPVYSHLFWGGDASAGEPVYSHLLFDGGDNHADDGEYSHLSRSGCGESVDMPESNSSDELRDADEGVAEDDWATVMGSQVRRNGVRSGSRGSWSTAGVTVGVSLIEAMEQSQTDNYAYE
jgi:hypothetical protein